ncbi:DUF4129 domain-containing protein [Novosphingobium huizhouense]|uniref:DUF4129 domain-containing protein n=1 Tax=Novosphingobium huizhouense TaxID=2866625 RepID=UPI001CD84B40|nr:DUF4129 domain-containing protein [Novosphingobium huizhouense]
MTGPATAAATATATANAAADAAESGERAWRAARGLADIQYAPLPPRAPTPPPDWLVALMKWLSKLFEPLGRLLGKGWGTIEILLLVAAAGGALWILASFLLPLWRQRGRAPPPPGDWTPDAGEAAILLADADALAAQGRFDEAAHLLLRRSVQQIAQAQPTLLAPSDTARDIAAMAALPANARAAFATMAGAVERALYALRPLAREDWSAAREAYAAFARVGLQAGAA